MLRRLTHFLGGLVAVFLFSASASAVTYDGVVCVYNGGYNVTYSQHVLWTSPSGTQDWIVPRGRTPESLFGAGYTVVSYQYSDQYQCGLRGEAIASNGNSFSFSAAAYRLSSSAGYGCPEGQEPNTQTLSGCVVPAPPFPSWATVQNGVSSYLKGYSFTGAAQTAGLTAAAAAYDAVKALSGSTPESALLAAKDAGYLASAKYTSDNETNTIMSRAILAGVAGVGILAALPAFLVGGSLAAAASLAVATVAAGGVAVDAYQSTASGSAIPTSASNTPVNVRLSSNSPSLAGVAELKLVEQYFVPSVSLSDLGSAAWEAQSGGGYKSTSTAGTTTLSADGKTVTTQSPGGAQTTIQATTAAVNNAQVPVVVKTVTAPVQTDVGQATASVSTVYDTQGQKLADNVVALTDAQSGGSRVSVTSQNSLSPTSGGTGGSIASQFSASSNLAAGTGASGSGAGSGAGQTCGGEGQPSCTVDLLTPAGAYQVPVADKNNTNESWKALETQGTAKLTEITSGGNQNGLLTWAMIPLPATGSCSDPVMSFAGHTVYLTGFCGRMAMVRMAFEYMLYLTTLFYVFKLASESSTQV